MKICFIEELCIIWKSGDSTLLVNGSMYLVLNSTYKYIILHLQKWCIRLCFDITHDMLDAIAIHHICSRYECCPQWFAALDDTILHICLSMYSYFSVVFTGVVETSDEREIDLRYRSAHYCLQYLNCISRLYISIVWLQSL